jgi:hypothetical protein
MKNGTFKVVREEYERSRKILNRWEQKVSRAKAIVKFWEAAEQKNKDMIGRNVLKAVVTDATGRATIHFESPAQIATFDDESRKQEEPANGKPS